MPDSTETTQTTLPIVVDDVDLVRVEKSLHSLGFFASTAKQAVSRSIVQVFRRPDGQRIQAKAVIEGIPSLGLPTTADRDKYMAFMKIALDQREFQGQLTNPIRFTGADMIKLLRLRKGGFHYDEINDWCKRMVATTIMSEASIFLADRRQYVTDTFHVFDRVVLVGEELADGARSDFYQVYLSQWQLTNLNQGYLLPLDFNAYLKLKRDISKALFGHLSVWFYASRAQSIEKRYTDLCQLLNIRAYPHLSKARSVLEPSLEELTAIGYISSWDLVRTARGAEFKILLSPGPRLVALPTFSAVVNPEARAALEAKLPAWVSELVAQGVAERKARQLALDVPDSQPVSEQIEYARRLIEQDRRGKGKIANPAGFIIWAIETNLAVPPDFESAQKRRAREEAGANREGSRVRSLELRNEYDDFCERKVKARLAAIGDAKRDAAVREHLNAIRREQPEWFLRAAESVRQEVALGRLRSEVRDSLALPTYDEWMALDTQERLF